MDKNWMTPEEAELKYCPKLEADCLGTECMAWVWQDDDYTYAEESPGEGWVRGDLADSIFGYGDKEKTKKVKYEWRKAREIAKGRCGIVRY